MNVPVTRLYPDTEQLPLHGLYLNHDLRAEREPGQPFVYTNFISSLDGRISEIEPGGGRRRVPKALANARDWRLYMELLAQCDAVLTTARHLRAIAAGRQRELASLGDAAYADLAAWRRERGLAQTPMVAVLSNRLDFPAAVVEHLPGGLVVLTGANAEPGRLEALRAMGVEVHQSQGEMRGTDMIDALVAKGLTHVYSIAGPGVMRTLLAARVLDRIYLSMAPLLLAGEPFDTLTRGPALTPPAGFRLRTLYHDPESPAPGGQLLFSFDRVD